jgi:ubiquitin-conjugating enzyme E2 D/E
MDRAKNFALSRLKLELFETKSNSDNLIENIYLLDDYFKWEAIINGPKNTPYANGKFKLKIEFPDNYPYKFPKIYFTTKIYHPNISLEDGFVNADVLSEKKWTPVFTVCSLIISIISLLDDPNVSVCYNNKLANLYKNDKQKYDDIVEKFTIKYATNTNNNYLVYGCKTPEEYENKKETKSENKGEIKSENKGEIKSENKGEIKSENKGEIKSENKGEIKSENKGEIKSENKGEIKSENKEENKSDNEWDNMSTDESSDDYDIL